MPPDMRAHSSQLPSLVGTVLDGGRLAWLFSDGTTLPVVAGGSDTPPAPPSPPSPPPAPPADPPKPADPPAPPAGPTKADVDRAKAEAKRSTEAAIAEQLGCSIEEAKTILEERRKADDEKKDEATKAKEAADAERAKAEQERAAAAGDRLTVRVERALLAAGVPIEEPKEVKEGEEPPKTLLDRARVQVLAEVKPEDDDASVKSVVERLKAEVPAFFAATPAGGTPSSVPGQQPPNNQPTKTGIDAGRERARRDREERDKRPKFMEGLVPLGSTNSAS
jgi:DNA-binding transcriptional MerR regulator